MRYKLIILTCLVIAFANASLAQTEDSWKTIDNPFFSFSVPKQLEDTKARGKDSFVKKYASDDIVLTFDYGMYSNNFGDWPRDTKFEKVQIDGKDAKIGTVNAEFHGGFPYGTQVYIKLDGGNALSMFAACKSETEVVVARKIFESIVFKSGKPKE